MSIENIIRQVKGGIIESGIEPIDEIICGNLPKGTINRLGMEEGGIIIDVIKHNNRDKYKSIIHITDEMDIYQVGLMKNLLINSDGSFEDYLIIIDNMVYFLKELDITFEELNKFCIDNGNTVINLW